jgi:4-hydroxy-4-methyl-2-oxoglutarate aldolase
MTEETLLRKLEEYGTPTLFESSLDVKALEPGIEPLYRPISMAGQAFTIITAREDNSSVHVALAEAPAGSILVVFTSGDTRHGLWGEIMTEAAMARGITGLVTDGGVRDSRAIRERGFPVFCANTAIPGTAKRSLGVLNTPVTIGGGTIRPGDIIIGDDDGLVVFSPELAPQLLELAEARRRRESEIMQRLKQGELTLDLLGLRAVLNLRRPDG